MLAVWEPILFMDLSKPGALVLRRLADPRAMHFWDPDHLVAGQLARDSDPSQAEPGCCSSRGTLWDLAAVYPPKSLWAERLPRALVFDGPVVQSAEAIAAELGRASGNMPGPSSGR